MSLRITEGIAGHWHYHLSREGEYKGLCGARVMDTPVRLDQWRIPFGDHFPKPPTWCAKCEELRKEQK